MNFEMMHINKSTQIFGKTQCKSALFSSVLIGFIYRLTLRHLKRRHNVNGISIVSTSSIHLFSHSDDS